MQLSAFPVISLTIFLADDSHYEEAHLSQSDVLSGGGGIQNGENIKIEICILIFFLLIFLSPRILLLRFLHFILLFLHVLNLFRY